MSHPYKIVSVTRPVIEGEWFTELKVSATVALGREAIRFADSEKLRLHLARRRDLELLPVRVADHAKDVGRAMATVLPESFGQDIEAIRTRKIQVFGGGLVVAILEPPDVLQAENQVMDTILQLNGIDSSRKDRFLFQVGLGRAQGPIRGFERVQIAELIPPIDIGPGHVNAQRLF
jgi:hypothetical protein